MAQTVVIDITARFTDETSKGLNKASRSADKLGDSLKKTQKYIDKIDNSKSYIKLELKDKVFQGLNKISKGVKDITSKTWGITVKVLDKATAPIRGVFNLLKNPIVQTIAILGVSIGLKDTIDTFANFEATMSKVQAISSASSEEMTAINEKAKEVGANTKFTATQAGEAFTYMAMAGWKSKEMLSGIDGIMTLAASSGEDLGTVSDIVTDAMTAFGLAADGTTTILKNGLEKEVANTTHFADVLAAAASNSNTNVAMLGESFKYAAPLAGQFKFTVEDTALALGLMANSGRNKCSADWKQAA